MINPFQEHANREAEYQQMLADSGGGATLKFTGLGDLTVNCTFDRIQDNYTQVAGGQSPMLMIEECEFMADQIPDESKAAIRKGLFCTFKPNPAAADVPCRLNVGGLLAGGLIYRFMLVDRNFAA